MPTGEVGHLLTRGPYTIRGYYRAEGVGFADLGEATTLHQWWDVLGI